MAIYVTVKCPICRSTIQFPLTSLSIGDIFCPLCSEGVLRPSTEMCDTDGGEYRIPFPWERLADIWRDTSNPTLGLNNI